MGGDDLTRVLATGSRMRMRIGSIYSYSRTSYPCPTPLDGYICFYKIRSPLILGHGVLLRFLSFRADHLIKWSQVWIIPDHIYQSALP